MLKRAFTVFMFLFSISLFSAVSVYAENLYVRPEVQTYGSGDGSSWENAFSGFSNILWGDGTGHVGAGDTLYLSGGPGIGSATYAQTLDVGASGTSSSPINIKIDAGNCEHNGLVIIDTNLITGLNGIRIGAFSYITLDGYNPAKPDKIGIDVRNAATGSPAVLLGTGASHNIIRYIDSHHNNTYSFSLEGDGGYNLVEYCKAHDNYGSNGKHGIRFGNDSYNILQYCKSYNNEGQGFLTSDSNHHSILYNKFYGNGWALKDDLINGVYIGKSSYNTISYNESYNNGGGGIQCYVYPEHPYQYGNIVTYNICYNNGMDPDDNAKNHGWGIVIAGHHFDTIVQHNICYNNTYKGIAVWDDATADVQFNSIYNNGQGSENGAELDFFGYNRSLCTVDNNYYSDRTDEVLIKWGYTYYRMNNADIAAYKAASGKDINSTFGGPNYSVTYPAYNWINATTAVELNDRNEGNVNMALPFDFTFYGTTYTSGTNLKVFQNGGISFDPNANLSAANLSGTTWPSSGSYCQKVIAPWYADTYNPNGPPYYLYKDTIGTAPNRKFVICWNYGRDASGYWLRYEVNLHETTNIIEFQYQSLSFAREHMPGINLGDGFRGFKIQDSSIGTNYGVKFVPL